MGGTSLSCDVSVANNERYNLKRKYSNSGANRRPALANVKFKKQFLRMRVGCTGSHAKKTLSDHRSSTPDVGELITSYSVGS